MLAIVPGRRYVKHSIWVPETVGAQSRSLPANGRGRGEGRLLGKENRCGKAHGPEGTEVFWLVRTSMEENLLLTVDLIGRNVSYNLNGHSREACRRILSKGLTVGNGCWAEGRHAAFYCWFKASTAPMHLSWHVSVNSAASQSPLGRRWLRLA